MKDWTGPVIIMLFFVFFFGSLRKVDPVLGASIPAQQWWVHTESAHEAAIIPLVGRRFFRISATIDEC